MPSQSVLLTFLAATLAVVAVPGPSVVYVVTRGVELGRRAGLLSVLGIETGALLHVAAATGGVTALVASSHVAFTCLQFVGAGYLVFLGVRQLLCRPAKREAGPPITGAHLFRSGVLVDLLNPKTGMFFLAFLPQFVRPERGAVPLQVATLGLCFVVLAALCDGLYAVTAAALADRLRSLVRAGRLRWVTGGVYVGLGALVVAS